MIVAPPCNRNLPLRKHQKTDSVCMYKYLFARLFHTQVYYRINNSIYDRHSLFFLLHRRQRIDSIVSTNTVATVRTADSTWELPVITAGPGHRGYKGYIGETNCHSNSLILMALVGFTSYPLSLCGHSRNKWQPGCGESSGMKHFSSQFTHFNTWQHPDI